MDGVQIEKNVNPFLNNPPGKKPGVAYPQKNNWWWQKTKNIKDDF